MSYSIVIVVNFCFKIINTAQYVTMFTHYHNFIILDLNNLFSVVFKKVPLTQTIINLG